MNSEAFWALTGEVAKIALYHLFAVDLGAVVGGRDVLRVLIGKMSLQVTLYGGAVIAQSAPIFIYFRFRMFGLEMLLQVRNACSVEGAVAAVEHIALHSKLI